MPPSRARRRRRRGGGDAALALADADDDDAGEEGADAGGGPGEVDAADGASDGASDGAAYDMDLCPADADDGREAAALACRVCTFAVTGSNFTEQHWYYCYTCGLTQSEGCCSVCVKVCHKGHVVSYSRRSRFFCDCGAGAGAARGINCVALTPRRGWRRRRRRRRRRRPTVAPPPRRGGAQPQARAAQRGRGIQGARRRRRRAARKSATAGERDAAPSPRARGGGARGAR